MSDAQSFQLSEVERSLRELSDIKYAIDQSAIVAVTDAVGDIIHVNDKFCQISKYPRAELIGQNHRIINSGYHPREFFVDLWQTIASGRVWEGEIRNRAKDGTFYWVHTTIVPFVNEKGKPHQYISIRYEITSRKLYEEQLKHSNQELQDFASVAAHDLQEPLRKIQAFADRLSAKFKPLLGDEGQDYLSRMMSAANRMRKLIDDLLTYSRVTTKTNPLVEVSLTEIVMDVLSDLEIAIEQNHAVVQVEPLPRVQADPVQMRQLFQNLISNALKFHRPNVVPQIEVRAQIRDYLCEIEVVDNGIGFDERYLDRVFTIFQRLHSRDQYDGTGVGLAVCRKIAQRHGGEITARSRLGEGSTFIVTIPKSQKSGERN